MHQLQKIYVTEFSSLKTNNIGNTIVLVQILPEAIS